MSRKNPFWVRTVLCGPRVTSRRVAEATAGAYGAKSRTPRTSPVSSSDAETFMSTGAKAVLLGTQAASNHFLSHLRKRLKSTKGPTSRSSVPPLAQAPKQRSRPCRGPKHQMTRRTSRLRSSCNTCKCRAISPVVACPPRERFRSMQVDVTSGTTNITRPAVCPWCYACQ